MISAKEAYDVVVNTKEKSIFKNPQKREKLIKRLIDIIEWKILYKAKKGVTSLDVICYLEVGVFTKWNQVYNVMPDIVKILSEAGFKTETNLDFNTGTDLRIIWEQ